MRKLYIDMTDNQGCTAYFMKDTAIIQAGATVYSMPVSARNAEYERLADAHDVHFIFDDMRVEVDFYTVPRVDIMAVDSQNGYIATVGALSDLDGDAPICYITSDKKTFLIACNMRVFLEGIENWRAHLTPYDEICFYQSKEDASSVYEFLDRRRLGVEEQTDAKARERWNAKHSADEMEQVNAKARERWDAKHSADEMEQTDAKARERWNAKHSADKMEQANAKARERWNAIHSDYERDRIQYDDWLDTFQDAINNCQTAILDLGCGSGNDTRYLLERGKRVIACDYAKNAIRNIRKNFPEVERAVCLDMTKGLPFENTFTELVVCDLSLHYFTAQKTLEILDEIKRVLRPGGLLLFRVNSVRDVNYGAGEGREVEHHLYETDDGRYKRFFDAQDIERFWGGWDQVYLREEVMERYELEKVLWKGAMRWEIKENAGI